jgi:hypothetical protein
MLRQTGEMCRITVQGLQPPNQSCCWLLGLVLTCRLVTTRELGRNRVTGPLAAKLQCGTPLGHYATL